MRDVTNGVYVRYTHANVASFFFIFVYAHVARGVYYGSYRTPRVLVWSIGVVILILLMAIAFLGLLHSPKWFKLNNTNNNNNNKKNNNKNNNVFIPVNNNLNKTNYNVRPNTDALVNQTNIIRKREFSTSSRLGFTVTFPCNQNSAELTKFIVEKNLNPVFIYENLTDSTVKTRLLNETRDMSGIYLILNKVTMDYYIGSASTGRFHARFSNHLFNFHGSKVVKNAVKKYKISSFSFLILELFPEIVNKENNKKLLDLEDFYLKSLLPNYNILTEAGSSFGYKHSEITRINMNANYSEERRMAIDNLNKGKSLSPSILELIKQSALNRTKPIYTEVAKKNINPAVLARRALAVSPRSGKKSKAILVYNFDDTVYGQFDSIVDAAKSLGCDQKTIRRALQTPKKILRRRWIVKFV